MVLQPLELEVAEYEHPAVVGLQLVDLLREHLLPEAVIAMALVIGEVVGVGPRLTRTPCRRI